MAPNLHPMAGRNMKSSLEWSAGILGIGMMATAEAGLKEQTDVCCGQSYVPTKFLCWSPHPNVAIWGKEVIKVKQGRESGAWFYRISVLTGDTRDLAPFLSLSAMLGHSQKAATCKPGRAPSPAAKSAGTLISDIPASRLREIIFRHLSHSVYGVLLWQPELTWPCNPPPPLRDLPITWQGVWVAKNTLRKMSSYAASNKWIPDVPSDTPFTYCYRTVRRGQLSTPSNSHTEG